MPRTGGDARSYGDAGTVKLIAHGGPGNAQLSTDLAQTLTLRVQVGCTLDVHRATVTSLSRIGFPLNRDALGGQSREVLTPIAG
jgi:hypothetical protein